jgi:hypothetical protein
MFVLPVKVKMKAGQAAAAEKVFAGPFKAAITAQPGFRDVGRGPAGGHPEGFASQRTYAAIRVVANQGRPVRLS